MNPYQYNSRFVQQPNESSSYAYYHPRQQPLSHYRQPTLESRVAQLESQIQQQITELTRQNEEIQRLNAEIGRINEEIIRLNQNDERHFDRMTRLNQRLRTVENNLNIPYTAGEDGF
jgi:septal ring factor EnvC (AmiA/AmiB activator)